MSRLLLFNKPFGVLSQFTSEPGVANLSSYLSDFPDFYPAGRLDRDSEGLLLLTADGALQHRIASPEHKLPKTYLAQVEGQPSKACLDGLTSGVELRDGPASAVSAQEIEAPRLWSRTPEVRPRTGKGTTWIELTLTEGRNRQVRRMTAAIGYPTLRLVRSQVGPWRVAELKPGEWKQVDVHMPRPPRGSGSRKAISTRRRNTKPGRG